MASSTKTLLTLTLLAAARLAAGHGAIVSAVGNAGGKGSALGIDSSTPRDGTRRNPFQQDSTRFRGAAANTVGETLAGGANKLEAGTKAIMAESGDSLPQVTAGGELQMTLHQVNADGGGPYTCMINADGTAQTWNKIQVTQNVPGRNSRNPGGAATDFPLTAAIPADQTCTGTVAGQNNVCLVRCQNAARAGPFGGVVPVQLASGGGNNNGNGTAAAAGTAKNRGGRRAAKMKSRAQKAAAAAPAISLAEDAKDPDVLAELLEDEQSA
ncbi:hypothetical protein VTI74DRAFT_10319 [Chaetomium olivicolor]